MQGCRERGRGVEIYMSVHYADPAVNIDLKQRRPDNVTAKRVLRRVGQVEEPILRLVSLVDLGQHSSCLRRSIADEQVDRLLRLEILPAVILDLGNMLKYYILEFTTEHRSL